MAKKTPTTRRRTAAPSSGAKKKALYPSPYGRLGKSRPTYTVQATDISNVQTTYTRIDQTTAGRRLYASCPDLQAAINDKSEWVAGPGSFIPRYTGADRQWGDIAAAWLTENYFPNLCISGPNYNYNKILQVSSIAIDVDGDHGMYFTYTRDGLPRIGLLPSHRIGQRSHQTTVTAKGKYEGYGIKDGVIVNDIGLPIAVQILGTDSSKDVIKPINTINGIDLLFDARWSDQFRGISAIASSRFDWEDRDDTDEYIKRYMKLVASIGLTVKSGDGSAIDSPFPVGVSEDSSSGVIETGVDVTPIQGGEIYFLNGKNNEEIKPVDNRNPSPEVEAAMMRITARALKSVGWHPELIYTKELGSGAPTRMVQSLARKTIATRQDLLERRARKIVLFGLATAMELGLIPRNNKDWTSWNYSRGPLLSVDNGNENSADIENIKIGIDTYANVCAKQGRDYYEVLTQNKVEGIEFIQAAEEMAKETGKSFDFCFNLIRQSTPNGTPVVPPDNSKGNS